MLLRAAAGLTGQDRGIRYRGVYQAAEDYVRGDLVTSGGGMWHSNIDNNRTKPGTRQIATALKRFVDSFGEADVDADEIAAAAEAYADELSKVRAEAMRVLAEELGPIDRSLH